MKLPKFSSTRVLVVGDVMLDRYWLGSTARISPEAPVPVFDYTSEDIRLGGAANVAINASALGAYVELLSVTGHDSDAKKIEDLLTLNGVQAKLIKSPNLKTTVKLRIVAKQQQILRVDSEDKSLNWDFDTFYHEYIQRLDRTDVVIMSDYNKGVLLNISPLIKAARARSKKVIVDPKGTHFDKYQFSTIITPNLAEFEAIVGKCGSEQEIERRGLELCRRLCLDSLLITRGEHGMTLLRDGSQPLHLRTEAKEVFDVTGAGDTVIATLGVSIASGLSLIESTKLSNTAAGIVVSKAGTSCLSINELSDIIRQDNALISPHPTSIDSLLAKIKALRAEGKTIVMTNGCFDILHVGHVHYLEQAKELGDILIVAINDDLSVKRLKGEGKPVVGIEERMRVVLALKCVDYVISFTEDTPANLYKTILPDVLVKGGDYSPNDVAGGSSVLAAGGQVVIVDYLSQYSTSSIIDKILKTFI